MSKTDIKTYPYQDNQRNCTVVKAVTEYGGRPVYAFAYTAPEDEFDYGRGEFIATKRLEAKIARKRAKSMRRKAANYDVLINYYAQQLKRAQKERAKALDVADKRFEEARVIETDLEEFLKNI